MPLWADTCLLQTVEENTQLCFTVAIINIYKHDMYAASWAELTGFQSLFPPLRNTQCCIFKVLVI